jgi:hypothetical protein
MSDFTAREREAGTKAARKLRQGLRKVTRREFANRSGELRKITASKRMKRGELQRLVITAPKHAFVQHYGFSKRKRNGVYQRLKATNFLNKAIKESNALEELATEITEIRGDEVMAALNF